MGCEWQFATYFWQGSVPVNQAAEAKETYACSLEEIMSILALLPETAATAFAGAAFMRLRHGEIQGLHWEN